MVHRHTGKIKNVQGERPATNLDGRSGIFYDLVI